MERFACYASSLVGRADALPTDMTLTWPPLSTDADASTWTMSKTLLPLRRGAHESSLSWDCPVERKAV